MKPAATFALLRYAWRGRLALIILTAVGTTITATPARASTPGGFDGLPAVSAEELQAMRGGFEFAGLEFEFGARLRTFVDGRLALESLIRYADAGVLTEHTTVDLTNTSVPSPRGAEPTDNGASASGTDTGTGGSIQALGGGRGLTPAQLDLPGIDLSGLKDATGILINDRSGAIVALHEATRERITSLVLNQANGRELRQELNVDVTVRNFEQLRDSIRSIVFNSRQNAGRR